MRFNLFIISFIIISLCAKANTLTATSTAQQVRNNSTKVDTLIANDSTKTEIDSIIPLLIDSPNFDSLLTELASKQPTLPKGKYTPAVYRQYQYADTLPMKMQQCHDPLFAQSYQWLDDYENSNTIYNEARQRFEMQNADYVKYNSEDMPTLPKEYQAYVDKVTTRIVFKEKKIDDSKLKEVTADIEQKKWIHNFDASLQFSQAYVSPNWYQGGNKSLNMIGQVTYNVKLNQKFYPKTLFEATLGYKLAMNSAPDDSIHSYNISEDIFQVNATLGYKAAKKWYYSANLLFKTQLLNSYPTNSNQKRSSFMSPAELNVGLGMTFNHSNKKKTFTFGASISPLSWNMKTVLDRDINPENYGVDNGHRIKNKFGSSAECTLSWKISHNITYQSRLFLFTDYDYAYADWEHTIDLSINRFLSTRFYAHMRYDTTTPYIDGSSWKKFQFKEIFSFGFTYHFGTI